MRTKSFETLVRTENIARLFFVKLCWKNYRRFCIRCRSYKVYRLRGKRYRCSRCRYTFTDFTGRWINKLRISYKKWLWILKLFELEISARKIAQQVELSYPTVLKAVHLMRMAIISAGKVYINGLEGFWSYAKERLIKHHGVSKEKFPLYLKEMEFRYNNRHKNIFNLLAKNICDLVPDHL